MDNNARNASRAFNVIKTLSAQPWANSPKILVSLVQSLVRSRLIYGLEAIPHITDSGLARLTQIEVHGLRTALGLPRSASDSLVYWAIQRSWFARVNELCNLSRKKSQEVAAHFRADF